MKNKAIVFIVLTLFMLIITGMSTETYAATCIYCGGKVFEWRSYDSSEHRYYCASGLSSCRNYYATSEAHDGNPCSVCGYSTGGGGSTATGNNYTITGSVYYSTLSSAVSAASAGNTIKVLTNVTDTSTVTIGKNLILDMQGYTITKSSGPITVSSGYTFQIKNGTISASSGFTPLTANGTLTMTSMTFNHPNTSSSYASIYCSASGTMNVNSTTITSKFLAVNGHGTLNINNSTIKAEGSMSTKMYALRIYAGNVTINNSTLVAKNSNTSYDGTAIGISSGATVIVNSGTITGNTKGIANDGTTLTIGDSSKDPNTTDLVIQGGTYGVTGAFKFCNGVIKGTNATPYSGTVTARTGYAVKTSGPTSGLYSAYLDYNYNYQINGTEKFYNTLAEAIAGASAGNVIKVLKNNTDTSTATFSKNLTINTNSKTITKNTANITINSGVTLSITGSGKITTEGAFYLINNSGTLNITSATIAHTGTSTSYYTVSNSGTMTVNSGTVSAKYRAIYSTGTVNVKGGTVKATADSAGALNNAYTDAIYTKGTLNISGGTLSAVNYGESYGVRTIGCYGGNVTITGGTITANAPYSSLAIEYYASQSGLSGTISISNSPTITATATGTSGTARAIIVTSSATDILQAITINISGGTISATTSSNTARAIYIIRNTGNVTITGGTITGNEIGVHYDTSSTGTLTIGSSSATLSTTSPSISGGSYGVYAANGFKFYNGVIKGTNATPYYGTPAIRSGHEIIKEGPTNSLYSAYLSIIRNYTNGTNYYTTLADAIAGTSAGGTITVLKTHTDTSTPTFSKNLTLNTNGLTVTNNTATITINSGVTLNITGTGTLTSSAKTVLTNEGTLNITNAKIICTATASGYRGIRNGATGVLTINSGKVQANVLAIYNIGAITVNGGEIKAEYAIDDFVRAINNGSGGSVTVKGGTLSANNTSTETTKGSRAIGGFGNITISGGSLSSTGYSAIAVEIYSTTAGSEASLNISGSPTLTAESTKASGYARTISVAGGSDAVINVPITISGGTITATAITDSNAKGIWTNLNEGTTTITGGNINSEGCGVQVAANSGKLTFGSSSSAINTANLVSSGGENGVYAPSGFNFNNGIIKGTSATPYSSTPTVRVGYEIVTEGPTDGLYSAYLVGYDNYEVNEDTYSMLTDAIAAANDGDTITILRAHTDETNAVVNKNITLNTNGIDIIKATAPITVNYGCILNINGNGSITGASGINTIKNNGVLNISDVTIDNENEKSSNIINNASGVLNINSGTIKSKFMAVNNYGTLYINDGNIEANHEIDGYVYGVFSRAGSNITMTGGTVTASNTSTTTATAKGARGITSVGADISISGGSLSVTGYSAYGIEPYGADGNINISGTAEITATSNDASGYVRALDIGEDNTTYVNINVNISGGRIVASGVNTGSITSIYNLKNNTGAITILGGEIIGAGRGINMTTSLGKLVIGDKDAEINKINPLIQGGTYGVITSDVFEFYNGVIKGTNATPYTGTPITQGEYYKVVTEGPDANEIYSSYIDFTPRYQIKETGAYYDTLEEAIIAASDGNTIILTKDNIDPSYAVVNKNLTLDTNGKTVTKETYPITVENGYTLNIIGTGTIAGTTSCNIIENNGTLNIEDTTITNMIGAENWKYPIVNNSEGIVNINSGTIKSEIAAIYNYGEVNLNNGTILVESSSMETYLHGISTKYNSKVTINGGSITANNFLTTYGSRGIGVTGSATIIINGGTIRASGYTGYGIELWSNSESTSSKAIISNSANISGTSEVDGGYARGISIKADGATMYSSVEIKGGYIAATATTVANADGIYSSNNSGTIKITSGTVVGSGNGVNLVSGEGTLEIGNNKQNVSTTNPTVSGGVAGVNAPGGFYFYNGVIKGTNAVPYTGEVNPRESYSVEVSGPESGLYSAYLSQNTSIYDATAYLEETMFKYDGTAKEPTEVVTFNDTQLIKGTDYEVTYKNNVNVGIATAVITGIGDYSGVISLNFIISNTDVDYDQIILDLDAPIISNMTSDVTAERITIKANIVDPQIGANIPGSGVDETATRYLITEDATTPSGDDVNWQESNVFTNDYQGDVFAWVKAVDNVGNISMEYLVITFKDFSFLDATYSLSPDTYEYDGTPKTPTVTVKVGDETLTQGTEYEVTYFNNVEVGVATAVVTGINDYLGSHELYFTIVDTTLPTAPIIDARLSTYSGTTYTSGTLTNKNVFIELTSTDANEIDVYEWSTNASSGFTSNKVIMTNTGVGRMRFDTEMNQTIFFRSKDKAGNYSNVSSITIRIDKTAPTGSIDVQENYLKNSDKYVNNNTVTINVLASDNISSETNIKVAFINEDEFSFSNSNSSITWFDYATTKSWTSSAGDGYKKVYVIFKDEAGNQSVYLAE